MSGKRWTSFIDQAARLAAGIDFIINSIEVAGLANVQHDFDIPLKYGINQWHWRYHRPRRHLQGAAHRSRPADILGDAEEIAPAWVLNYTNAMSILTQVALTRHQYAHVRTLPQCAGDLKITGALPGCALRGVEWSCAGINHNAWFTILRIMVRLCIHAPPWRDEPGPRDYEQDPCAFGMMLHFGAFVTRAAGTSRSMCPLPQAPRPIERYSRSGYRARPLSTQQLAKRGAPINDASIREMLAAPVRSPSSEP